jgi:CDP-diacylglycerol--glycerol-3-phosphate 3-phosphatidyltransferase
MSIVEWLNEGSSTIPVGLAAAVAFVAALLETALGSLLYVPGGPVVIVAAAGVHTVSGLILLYVVVVIGRVIGDHVAFASGRNAGPGLRSSPLFRRLGVEHWDATAATIQQRGIGPVLLTRLVPTVRALAPVVDGASGGPYGAFLRGSAVSAVAWSALWILVGILVRASFHIAHPYLGVGGWAVLIALAIVGIVYLVARRLVVRLPDGDPRLVLGDTSVAGMSPHPSGSTTSLRQRLFHEDEWRTLPNVISAIRILLLPVFGVLLFVHAYWASIIVLLIVFLTDFVDGFIARRFHQTSALGAWLDPVADRLTVVFVVAAFAASGIVPWQLVVILLIPDILSGAWAVLAFHGAPDVRVSKVGKVRTALLFVGLFMMLFGEAVSAFTDVLVGLGFAFFVLGVVGHYLAMTRNARGLITLWARPETAPSARP